MHPEASFGVPPPGSVVGALDIDDGIRVITRNRGVKVLLQKTFAVHARAASALARERGIHNVRQHA